MKEKKKFRTLDFIGAYLYTDVRKGKKIFIRLAKCVAAIYLELFPEYKKYVCEDGTIVLLLEKALYGLTQSGKMWYELIKGILLSLDYKVSSTDICKFIKIVDGRVSTICLYVDDLGVSSSDEDWYLLLKGLDDAKLKYTTQEGNNIKYIGMELKFDYESNVNSVTITMTKYITELCKRYGVTTTKCTPATPSILSNSNSEIIDTNSYLSLLMALLYIDTRVRHDIKAALSILRTRVTSPTKSDMSHLYRILEYLNGTKELGVCLKPEDNGIWTYVDASFAIHKDAKSHTGIMISLGKNGGPIFVKSKKQSIVSRSSYEAELIALNEPLSQILWAKKVLSELGYDVTNSKYTVYQDNQATMATANKGFNNSKRSKHINVRYYYVKELIDNGDIVLHYLPTDDMIADVLTKIIVGEKFYKLRGLLLNM